MSLNQWLDEWGDPYRSEILAYHGGVLGQWVRVLETKTIRASVLMQSLGEPEDLWQTLVELAQLVGREEAKEGDDMDIYRTTARLVEATRWNIWPNLATDWNEWPTLALHYFLNLVLASTLFGHTADLAPHAFRDRVPTAVWAVHGLWLRELGELPRMVGYMAVEALNSPEMPEGVGEELEDLVLENAGRCIAQAVLSILIVEGIPDPHRTGDFVLDVSRTYQLRRPWLPWSVVHGLATWQDTYISPDILHLPHMARLAGMLEEQRDASLAIYVADGLGRIADRLFGERISVAHVSGSLIQARLPQDPTDPRQFVMSGILLTEMVVVSGVVRDDGRGLSPWLARRVGGEGIVWFMRSPTSPSFVNIIFSAINENRLLGLLG